LGALWKGSSFPKDFHKGSIALYPQLLAYDCANLHSNISDGCVYKINLYNAIPDRMQVNFSQRPIPKLDLVCEIFKCLGKFKSESSFIQDINVIETNVGRSVNNLMERIKLLEDSEVSLRAEFRVELKRIVSMAHLINHFMSDEFIQSNTVILKMADFSRYLNYQVRYLTTPIHQSLGFLKGTTTTQFRKQFDPLISPLITLSAFESLLTFTLFGGTTHSYLNKMLWSNKAAESFEPLRLLTSLKEKNRLTFSGTSWDEEMMLIRASNLLLASMIEKYSIKEGLKTFECHRLLIKVQGAKGIQEKADILWGSYFNVLWKSAHDDFFKRSFSTDDLKLSHVKNSQYIIFPKDKLLTPTKAVEMIFNVEKLKYPAWKLPFLVVYNELINKNSLFQKELVSALTEFAERNIEYVHNCLATDRYFPNPTFRSYFKVKKSEHTIDQHELKSPKIKSTASEIQKRSEDKKQPNIIESPYLLYVENKRLPTINMATSHIRLHNSDLPNKRNRVEYTVQEKIDLFRGWNKLCHYEDVYSRIVKCDALCLGSGSSSGKPRSNKDLNDVMKRLIAAQKVFTDEMGRRYLNDGEINLNDCIQDFNYIDPKFGKVAPKSTKRASSRSPVIQNVRKQEDFDEIKFTSSFEMFEDETPISATGFPSPISDRETKVHPGKRSKAHYRPERDLDSFSLLSVEKARADHIQARRSSEDRITTIKLDPQINEIVDQTGLYQERYNPELPSFIEEIKSDDEVDNSVDTKCVNFTAFIKNEDLYLDNSNERQVAIPGPKLQIKSLAGLIAAKAKEKTSNDKIAKKQLQIARVLKMKSSKSAEMSMEFPEEVIDSTMTTLNNPKDAVDMICPTTFNDCDELFGPLCYIPPAPALFPDQSLASSILPEIEYDASPNRKALHAIISKYFRTPIQCKKVVNTLDTLEVDESITLNELIEKTPPNSRPSKEQRMAMLQELQNAKLIYFSQKSRSFIIKKICRQYLI